ncbi:hypothetical protein BZA70DRAFT_115206 [Myxozyma melibiosi]|uniref:Proteasome assembly chaperone 3 n=1 Tax=Myxozyma melibiosi TaxID=54550 RepID=A0ABR1FCN8_9ASCO
MSSTSILADGPPVTPAPASSSSTLSAPVKTRQSVRMISGVRVDVVVYSFADKIMVLVSQNGRLGKMYYVPLASSASLSAFAFGSGTNPGGEDEYSLLPLTHLTPTPVLGSSADDVEGRIYAVQVASLVSRQSPDERRTVIVGMAATKREATEDLDDAHRSLFLDVLAMVAECRVW